jgi:hypothetical protein
MRVIKLYIRRLNRFYLTIFVDLHFSPNIKFSCVDCSPQLLKCLSTCPTCHAPCTVDDLRPDATLAAAIELFEPARWSVLSVLDEYAAICIKSTPLRTSSTDDSSLSAGDRGALDTVNEEVRMSR